MSSDEFIKVATQEILQELNALSKLLEQCSTDSDIAKHSTELQKSTHKIKGLAPMMGQNVVGDIAAQCDNLLKKIISSDTVALSCELISKSNSSMISLMDGDNPDIADLLSQLKSKNS